MSLLRLLFVSRKSCISRQFLWAVVVNEANRWRQRRDVAWRTPLEFQWLQRARTFPILIYCTSTSGYDIVLFVEILPCTINIWHGAGESIFTSPCIRSAGTRFFLIEPAHNNEISRTCVTGLVAKEFLWSRSVWQNVGVPGRNQLLGCHHIS
jgi:hypothetical protein